MGIGLLSLVEVDRIVEMAVLVVNEDERKGKTGKMKD